MGINQTQAASLRASISGQQQIMAAIAAVPKSVVGEEGEDAIWEPNNLIYKCFSPITS